MTAFELVISPDGSVASDWWTPEIAVYICDLCGARGTEKCSKDGIAVCVNQNPYCG